MKINEKKTSVTDWFYHDLMTILDSGLLFRGHPVRACAGRTGVIHQHLGAEDRQGLLAVSHVRHLSNSGPASSGRRRCS